MLNLNLNNEVIQLFNNQAASWLLMRTNYDDLKFVSYKQIYFDGFVVKVQYNPARIISSSAKVDKQTIEKRPCFLCTQNRPTEQLSIDFNDRFLILVNPFPIFPGHLTISHKEHIPQLMANKLIDMLELAKALPDFTIFYNGARCGASAPDHFHFQAGTRNFMPLDNDITVLQSLYGKLLQNTLVEIWKIDDGLRRFFTLESDNLLAIEEGFNKLFEILSTMKSTEYDPDLNIHCLFENNRWRVLLFPRIKHRPWQFFAEDEGHILFSPAAVDLGGVVITPLEKDFYRMDRTVLTDMMQQITIPKEGFLSIGL